MSERIYEIGNKSIKFSEIDEFSGCLCTFPHDDHEKLDIDRVVSLVLFGAAVRLIHAGEYAYQETIVIPDDLPGWIIKGVYEAREKAEKLEALQLESQKLCDEINRLTDYLEKTYHIVEEECGIDD